MSTEAWRPVPGFADYEVSNLGRVRSHRRRQSRLLVGGISRHGYPKVRLYSAPSVSRSECVHRLVALAFLGPRPEGMEVRHLDGNKTNNVLGNLVYGTRSENQLDNVAHGTHAHAAQTECVNGHPFDEVNTYHRPGRPHRTCRACTRDAKRRYQDRLAARAA